MTRRDEPRRPRRRPREGEVILSVDDLHVYYGNIAAVKGLSFQVREGEIVTLIGSNGAGKSTTLRTISGPDPAAQGPDHLPGQADHQRPTATRSSALGHLPLARGPPDLPAHDRRREPRPRRVPAQGQGGDRRGPRPGPRAVPAARRAHQPEGRHHVRRRAADARRRPGDDGQAQGPAARRAVDGSGPGAGRPDLRHHRARSGNRASRCCWSSRTPSRPSRVADYAYVLESGNLKLEGEAASSPRTTRSSAPTSAADDSRVLDGRGPPVETFVSTKSVVLAPRRARLA